ncbi:Transcriptional regulator [Quaeritorhiza haematococci]|nr:Transcriptional regulator [Quaeritorhiza haematococci]
MAATPTAKDLSSLDFSPIPTDAKPKLFHQYITHLVAAASASTSSSASATAATTASTPGPPPPIPTSSELQKLQQELEALLAAAKSRTEVLTANSESLSSWLRAKEKAAAGQAGSTGGKAGSSTSLAESSSAGGAKEAGKDKKTKVKLKVGDALVKQETESSTVVRKTEDGSIQLAIQSNGVIKIKKSMSPPPAPASTSKPPSRTGTPKPKTKGLKKDQVSATKDTKRKRRGEGEDVGAGTPPSTATIVVDVPEQLRGEPMVEGDLSKVKVTNPVPFQQFNSFCDQFFRNVTEDDLRYLEDRGDEVTPFIMPPLGRHYTEQWAEEDGALIPSFDPPNEDQSGSPSRGGGSSSGQLGPKEYEEIDDTVHVGDVFYGPLTERIICSLFDEGILDMAALADGGSGSEPEDESNELRAVVAKGRQRSRGDMMDLENRLRAELKHIGLIDEDEADWEIQDNDEISVELRARQQELRDLRTVNRFRKDRLLERAKSWMAWQEYNNLLDEINKQIELAYVKRFRVAKKKKAKASKESKPMSESVVQLLERRKRILRELGPLFNLKKFSIPENSIYEST